MLRDLILAGKRYFREFLASNEGVASNILSNRLKLLEASGMVTRRSDPEHARQFIYAPTKKALDLLPSMLELVRWSAAWHERTAAPPGFVRRIAADRDGFVAEIRSRHRTAR